MSGFDAARFKGALLTREIGRTLKHAALVGSTNHLALGAAQAGAEGGLVILAEEQSQGRGRGGSSWVAPAGTALLCSVLLRPHGLAPAAAAQFPFVAALAVGGALLEGGLPGVVLKWPNDVLVGGAKIAGILCESRSQGGRLEAVVIGMGINVNQEKEQLPEGATSIRVLTGEDTDRALLLAEVLNRLEGECAREI